MHIIIKRINFFSTIFSAVYLLVTLGVHGLSGDFSRDFNGAFYQQQQQWDFDAMNRRQEQFKKNTDLMRPWQSDDLDKKSRDVPDTSEAKFLIHTINLVGITKISRSQQAAWLTPLKNTPIGLSEIDALIRSINNWYTGHGYVTSRAFLALNQSIATGELTIIVEEGVIQDIVDAWGNPASRAIRLALPFVGDILNIRDLEQGLEQLNRLAHNSMVFDLMPAETGYGTVVVVRNRNQSGLIRSNRASLNYFYQTDQPYSWFPNQITLIADNPLLVNDQWTFSYSQSVDDEFSQSNSLYTNVTVPYGHWLLNYTYSLFNFHNLVESNNDLVSATGLSMISYHGTTEQNAATLIRTVYRTQQTRTVAEAQIAVLKKETYQEGVLSPSASYKRTLSKVGINHDGAAISTSLFYHQGLKWFNASKDLDNPGPTEPRFIFNKVTLETNLTRPVRLPIMSQPAIYQLRVEQQWTRYPLFSSDRIALGGLRTVRGFNNALSGDYGYYAQHTVSLPTAKPAFSVLLGADHGTIFSIGGQAANGGNGEGSIMSGVFGFRYQSGPVFLEVVTTRPLQWSADLRPENDIVYATLNMSWR